MKMWQKRVSIIFAIAVIAVAILIFFQGQKECCLCNSFRFHAPCLIDLETGDMIELDLYFPHETKVAELADPQPAIGTFSFVRLGNVSGTKQTAPERVDLHIPNDKTYTPALCKNCRKQLPFGHTDRYVFADLYGIEQKILIPIERNTILSLRCYNLTMVEDVEKGGISVVIQGALQP